MDYIGEKCSACHREFEEGDDIVVCPDCGSPHHRDCYRQEGRCAHADKHLSGYKWERKAPGPAQRTDDPFTVCPVCRFPNDKRSESCVRCGARLGQSEGEGEADREGIPGNMPQFGEYVSGLSYLGFDPKEDMGEGTTLGEVTSFVGTNTLYYIPIFKRMKDLGKKMSFNLSCLAFPTLYFANRKMWFWAVLVGIVGIVLSLPAAALNFAASLSDMSEMERFVSAVNEHKSFIQELDSIFSVADWILRVMYCLFGNWLYFRYVLTSVRKLRARGVDGKADPVLLAEAGGVRPANMLIMIGIMLVLSLAGVYVMARLLTW